MCYVENRKRNTGKNSTSGCYLPVFGLIVRYDPIALILFSPSYMYKKSEVIAEISEGSFNLSDVTGVTYSLYILLKQLKKFSMQPRGLSERKGGLLEGGWKARYDDNSLDA